MKNSFENRPREKKNATPNFLVVGGAKDEFRQKAKEQFEKYFGEGHLSNMSPEARDDLEKNERQKTPEELELIAFANIKTNELMEKAGIPPCDVPEKNFHIISSEFYKKIDRKKGGSSAVALLQFQGLFFNADEIRGNNIFFSSMAFHELVHLKSVFALEVKERGDKATMSIYRAGFTVGSTQKMTDDGNMHKHFSGLDEAVVASEERKYIEEVLNLPMFKEERDRLGSEDVRKAKEKIAARASIPADEIYWLGEDKKSHIEVGYYHQRRVLKFVSEEIQKDFSDKYKTVGEVSDEFTKSLFNGRLLTVARPVEKTFGKGSLRVLGAMGCDKDSAINTLETLKSMRRARLQTDN